MHTVKLGNQGLEVSALGLGCMGMSEFYGTKQDERESVKTLHYALEQGVNFWDTADMYGPFTNEQLIARAIKESGQSRDKFILATKFGVVRDDDLMARGINGSPDYVRKACEASLKRLGVDYIDLYYQHRVDLNVPIEDTVGAMADLVKEGKVRYLGLSEASAKTLRQANKIHAISALQSEYSLWTRDVENEVIPACAELGVGLVAYSPLGRGFLAGAIKQHSDLVDGDWRLENPRFSKDNFIKNLSLLDQIQTLCREYNCTAAQLVLAWILNQSANIVPIPGTTKSSRITENIGALNIKLDEDQLHAISTMLSMDSVRGSRYSSDQMVLINAS